MNQTIARMLASFLITVAFMLVGLVDNARAQVFYDADFSVPDTVGSPPIFAFGAPFPRAHPTFVWTTPGATALVTSASGGLTNTPAELSTASCDVAQLGYCLSLMGFYLADVTPGAGFEINVDLEVFNSQGSSWGEIYLQTPSANIISFYFNGAVSVYDAASGGFLFLPVGYDLGQPNSVSIFANRITGDWELRLNGNSVYTGELIGGGELTNVELRSLSQVAGVISETAWDNVFIQAWAGDTDQDGVLDDVDNCTEVQNGPAGGTCISTTSLYINQPCTSAAQCGPGICSLAQEDLDDDGIGDACATSGRTLYYVDFAAPHIVGSPPLLGVGESTPRVRPTSIFTGEGSSVVVESQSGALTNQPLELTATPCFNCSSVMSANVEFLLSDLPLQDAYRFSARVQPSGLQLLSLVDFFFLGSTRIIFERTGDVHVGDASGVSIVGSYPIGVPLDIELFGDRIAETWSLTINDTTVYTGELGPTPSVMRASARAFSNQVSGAAILAIDDVLIEGVPADSDSDGVPNPVDNCLLIPNGPLQGTCTAGSALFLGELCSTDGACGTGGVCSRAQEDSDVPGNGVGDACDLASSGVISSNQNIQATDSPSYRWRDCTECSYVNPDDGSLPDALPVGSVGLQCIFTAISNTEVSTIPSYVGPAPAPPSGELCCAWEAQCGIGCSLDASTGTASDGTVYVCPVSEADKCPRNDEDLVPLSDPPALVDVNSRPAPLTGVPYPACCFTASGVGAHRWGPDVPTSSPPDQDGDTVADICDNCTFIPNPDQDDYDNDSFGDACDPPADSDSDGIGDPYDNCAGAPNGPLLGSCIAGDPLLMGTICTDGLQCGTSGVCSLNQEDYDEDGLGDPCDPTPMPEPEGWLALVASLGVLLSLGEWRKRRGELVGKPC